MDVELSGGIRDDVVQDAFIRAYRGLRVTDRPMALRPWLYMIVRNVAIDALRTVRRSDHLEDDARRHGFQDVRALTPDRDGSDALFPDLVANSFV